MTQKEIIAKLEVLKPQLEREGFMIVGLFGSYARGDYDTESDVDILYRLIDPELFTKQHGGFGAFTKIRETKQFLERELACDVDFVEESSLGRTGKKYILGEVVYV